jgi:hypothetical protein
VLNFAWLEDDIAIRQNHRRSRLARAALPSLIFYLAVTPQRAILIFFGPASRSAPQLIVQFMVWQAS